MSTKIRTRKRGNTYSYSFDISKHPRRMKEKGGFATEDALVNKKWTQNPKN